MLLKRPEKRLKKRKWRLNASAKRQRKKLPTLLPWQGKKPLSLFLKLRKKLRRKLSFFLSFRNSDRGFFPCQGNNVGSFFLCLFALAFNLHFRFFSRFSGRFSSI